jgi:hypothetical protein
MRSRFLALSREQLAVIVPELLLIGQLIDRSGMAWCLAAFGRETMAEIAIEEWAAASPVYTRRMQRALGYAPSEPGTGDVVTIFKGLQLDIGAPPQFMDFRYTVHDRWHGEFRLDHCGALMDVEPLGEEYVRTMCHDIEDGTFDATAIASHPKARIRPVHRPPRSLEDQVQPAQPGRPGRPHCAWTVIIDESHPAAAPVPALAVNERSRAANLELAPIDRADEGMADYSGPLVSDLDFAAFSRSALARIADEVCLQMHLLDRGFALALARRAGSEADLLRIRRKQLTGIAGLGAERLARALDLGPSAGPPTAVSSAAPTATSTAVSSATSTAVSSAARLLAVHPLLNPAAYVSATIGEDAIVVRPSPAHEDQAWVSLCGPEWTAALRAIVRALDPHLDISVAPYPQGGPGAWRGVVMRRPEAAPEAEEVTVTKFSTGAAFAFKPRRSLPLTWT